MAPNEELDRFREEWLREVRQQSQHNALPPSVAPPVVATESPTSPKLTATRHRAPRSPTSRRPTDLSLSTTSYHSFELTRSETHSALVCLHRSSLQTMASMTQTRSVVLYKGNL